MTFTRDNWDRFNPPNFVSAHPAAEVAASACTLLLRDYDIACLHRLLADRGIQATKPSRYERLQGKAARYRWWRDSDAVIPRGLLLLCAMTQRLAPPRAQKYCFTCENTGLLTATAGPRSRPKSIPCHETACPTKDPQTDPRKLPAEFPFRPDDGRRDEPAAFVVLDNIRLPMVVAHLPHAVQDRLSECGVNHHGEGWAGAANKKGVFFTSNRAAGMRRLLEAVRVGHPLVDPWAPPHFRGIELYSFPPSATDYEWNYEHFLEASAQVFEARARRLEGKELHDAQRKGLIDDTRNLFQEQRHAKRMAANARGELAAYLAGRTPARKITPRTACADRMERSDDFPPVQVIPKEAPKHPPLTENEIRRAAEQKQKEAEPKVPAGTNKSPDQQKELQTPKRRGKLRAGSIEEFDPSKLG